MIQIHRDSDRESEVSRKGRTRDRERESKEIKRS